MKRAIQVPSLFCCCLPHNSTRGCCKATGPAPGARRGAAGPAQLSRRCRTKPSEGQGRQLLAVTTCTPTCRRRADSQKRVLLCCNRQRASCTARCVQVPGEGGHGGDMPSWGRGGPPACGALQAAAALCRMAWLLKCHQLHACRHAGAQKEAPTRCLPPATSHCLCAPAPPPAGAAGRRGLAGCLLCQTEQRGGAEPALPPVHRWEQRRRQDEGGSPRAGQAGSPRAQAAPEGAAAPQH